MTIIDDGLELSMNDGFAEMADGTAFFFGAHPDVMAEFFNPEMTAHSLSMMCRYNGHTKRFYSVAEHSLIMAEWVMKQSWGTPKRALTALHHDDAEVVIGDMISPVKRHDPFFKKLEARIDQAVSTRYGTMYPFPDWLKDIDSRIIKNERSRVMNFSANSWFSDGFTPLHGLKFKPIIGRSSFLIRRAWLQMHYDLVHLQDIEDG